MGEVTKIQWAHHTFNPWWGCEQVSPGCANCYAEEFAGRFGTQWGATAARRFFGDKHWNEPLSWDRAAKKAGERRRVFCASMADVCELRDDLVPHRERLCRLVDATENLDWMMLTKRPENAPLVVPERWWKNPPQHVWWGATVENQRFQKARTDALRAIPAEVRFISAEPLLEAVEFDLNGIDLVILGAESGRNARPFQLRWARIAKYQCEKAGVSFFMKQCGDNAWNGLIPLRFDAPKGGDPNEWPKDLRCRQLPKPVEWLDQQYELIHKETQ